METVSMYDKYSLGALRRHCFSVDPKSESSTQTEMEIFRNYIDALIINHLQLFIHRTLKLQECSCGWLGIVRIRN